MEASSSGSGGVAVTGASDTEIARADELLLRLLDTLMPYALVLEDVQVYRGV